MIIRIGVYEAKSRLAHLLKQVEAGDTSVTITRRGVPVALLIPVHPPESTQEPRSDPASHVAPSDPTIVPQRGQNTAGERKSYGLTLAELTAASR